MESSEVLKLFELRDFELSMSVDFKDQNFFIRISECSNFVNSKNKKELHFYYLDIIT